MEQQFVTIAKFKTVPESDFFRSLLVAQGFDAYTRGTAAFNAMPLLSIVERIRLQVPADQAREAIDFLRQQAPPEDADLDQVGEEDYGAGHTTEDREGVEQHCPDCGALLMPPPKPRLYGRVLLAFWTGFFLAFMQGGPGRVEFGVVAGVILACCMGVYVVSRRRPWTCAACGWDSDG